MVGISATYSNAKRNSPPYFFAMFHGSFWRYCADQYSFRGVSYSSEPEYGSDEESSTSSNEDDVQDDRAEQRIGCLV